MKQVGIFLIALLFCVSAYGQGGSKTVPTVGGNARAEFMDPKYWNRLAEPEKDQPLAFTLYSRNILPNPEGQYELWVKIVPVNVPAFIRKYDLPSNTAFVLQYATIDCSRNVLLLERTGIYDAGNVRIGEGSARLTPKEARDRVKPGSIGAAVFHNFCVRLG